LDTARSSSPSPPMSPIATDVGFSPTGKVCAVLKNCPLPGFVSTVMLSETAFAVTRSMSPSPSKSAASMPMGSLPATPK
jgi:hypothetical protein